ncbi:Mycothiol acetyltransferase [Fundidesulfovibrio magnetotacticus]|uniref:Mycothiol acetyltransferase n=1 Tax=Fundidesulfovibrio magnetotacticus TaxID=2730080 RepID=A0A6V8LPN8_9BACT|nr:GNAT family N-acetyltransferase [Fundidesulfovibrio magnetotacticus]GFK94522.1 Mycothiol acetyltransferase [Fundidesulfovibrio magnetotacticus]
MSTLPGIVPAAPQDTEAVRALFRDYQQSLGISLCFQNFETELATLPGRYAPPHGEILLARDAQGPVGCVAMRPLDQPGVCEMKRLFVRPQAQGTGLGRALARAVVAAARAAGYRVMRLDTLPSMGRAIALYESLGFRDIPPYCANPHEGVRYLELDLTT